MDQYISCEKAIEIYNKLLDEFKDIYPAGKVLLCLDGRVAETHDVDIVSKVHTTPIKLIYDNVVIHVFPWNKELHEECYSLNDYTATYYCMKAKLYQLSLRGR